MSADDCDSGAAQLLGNGGKLEPYTILIMIQATGRSEFEDGRWFTDDFVEYRS
jgi:hypothetical protein